VRVLTTPAARRVGRGDESLLLLHEVEALLASKALVVDACRLVVRDGGTVVSLASRPVLFALARALGEAWPGDVSRATLLARAFEAKLTDESDRARLRVEVVVLAHPVEEKHAGLLALLADGEAWPSSALALALGTSQRTVQRALDSLAAEGKVRFFRRGRARRWMTRPMPEFTTTLLLPAPLPSG
jgi:hypothetical protein